MVVAWLILTVEDAYTFHPFPFFFFFWQPFPKQTRSRGGLSGCRGAGREHDHHNHHVRSSTRKHLPSLEAQFSSLRWDAGWTLFNYYKDAYTFHPFPFFFFLQSYVQRARSRGRQSGCRGAGKEHDHHNHRVRSSLRKLLPSLKAQFSSLRWDARWPLFNITRTLTPSTLSLSSSFRSLGFNNFGPEGGKAVAAALAKNTTITTVECVHPLSSRRA